MEEFTTGTLKVIGPAKKYIFQCGFCPEKTWWKIENEVRVWEKEVLYNKPEKDSIEREGELVMCKKCYSKLK